MTGSPSRTRVVGLGAGGHASVVLDALASMGTWELLGLLDARRDLAGRKVGGVPVLGGDDLLQRLRGEGVDHVVLGIGSTGDATVRRRVAASALAAGFSLAIVIHARATVSPTARLARGVVVLPGACVNASSDVGEAAIVNTGAIVEHDCRIGAYAHVATGARLGGGVSVGDGAHVGIGATVLEGRSVGRDAIVGGGAVVVRDVPDRTVVVGVPARVLRRVGEP